MNGLPASVSCMVDFVESEPAGHAPSYVYGVVRDAGSRQLLLAHRAALSLALGRPLRLGATANHRCGNKWCVRPRHLYEGTQAENMADWWASRLEAAS